MKNMGFGRKNQQKTKGESTMKRIIAIILTLALCMGIFAPVAAAKSEENSAEPPEIPHALAKIHCKAHKKQRAGAT